MAGPKRRKLAPRRLDVLTNNLRDHLVCGCYFWSGHPNEVEFENDAHRRAVWLKFRTDILAEGCHPGRRPEALWQYDLGDWEQFGETESDAVYQLLKQGKLAPVHFNATIRIASEIEQIEADWRDEIRIFLCRGNNETVPKIRKPVDVYGNQRGCPAWFYRRHAEAVLAREQEARRRFYAQYHRDGAGTE
jgi:hypothetical protein